MASDWVQLLGYAASFCVFATFCMKGMLPLRIVALGSNVLFGLYGFFGDVYPVLFLHVLLLPINIFRLVQIRDSAAHCVSCGSRNERVRRFCGECGALFLRPVTIHLPEAEAEQCQHGSSAYPAPLPLR
jgi:hypothetical protein